MRADSSAHARVLALAKEPQWTAGIEKYKKGEVLSTRGLSGWWALAILRSLAAIGIYKPKIVYLKGSH